MNIVPGLGIILVGDNIESRKYVKAKERACFNLGVNFKLIELDINVTNKEVIEKINELNKDKSIHGVLVQLPLPENLDTDYILDQILPNKDVDGFHIINAGKLFLNREKNLVPCTPLGCIKLLDHYDIELKGKNVVIIGCSNIVGIPLSMMLLQRDATVTLCHKHTIDLKEHTIQSDIIFCCCGVPGIIKKDMIILSG